MLCRLSRDRKLGEVAVRLCKRFCFAGELNALFGCADLVNGFTQATLQRLEIIEDRAVLGDIDGVAVLEERLALARARGRKCASRQEIKMRMRPPSS